MKSQKYEYLLCIQCIQAQYYKFLLLCMVLKFTPICVQSKSGTAAEFIKCHFSQSFEMWKNVSNWSDQSCKDSLNKSFPDPQAQ